MASSPAARSPSWGWASRFCIRASSRWCGSHKERGLRAEVTTNALLLDDGDGRGAPRRRPRPARGQHRRRYRRGLRPGALGRLPGARGRERAPPARRVEARTTARASQIGVEFVAMRSNVGELAGLGRLAAQLGATFIIVSNVLRLHGRPARRDALRPARQLAQRRGDDRRAALAAAGVRLGRDDRGRRRRGAHTVGSRVASSAPSRRRPAATAPSSRQTPAPSPGTAASAPARRCCTPTPASCADARSACCAGRSAVCRT